MATHSSILAWRIPGTEEPGGLRLWGRTQSDTTEATQQQQHHIPIMILLIVLGLFLQVFFFFPLVFPTQRSSFSICCRLVVSYLLLSCHLWLQPTLFSDLNVQNFTSLFSYFQPWQPFSGKENVGNVGKKSRYKVLGFEEGICQFLFFVVRFSYLTKLLDSLLDKSF